MLLTNSVQPAALVKRAPNFATEGGYDVKYNGKIARIFRDPENGWWYVDGPGHYSQRCIGFTKVEAVAEIVARNA